MGAEEGVHTKIMNSKSLQELIKNLRVFYKCPSCGSAYRSGDIVFLGRVEEHCFMQLTCHDCGLPILATILTNLSLDGTLSVPAKAAKKRRSDLKPKERQVLTKLGEINSGEIADFYQYLCRGSGDYQTLIHKTRK